MERFNVSLQPTNNENILKFIVNTFLTQATSYEFKNIDDAAPSPLAQQLFYLPFVKTVYISQNFVAIEKYNIVSWEQVQDEVAQSIADYLNQDKPVILEEKTQKKVPITLYAESTPNPGVMKFVANKPLADGTFEFKNIDDAKEAPLAQRLFNFPFVKEVFISANYVSVAKYDMAEWQDIAQELRDFIRQHLEDGQAIFTDAFLNSTEEATEETKPQAARQPLTDIEAEIVAVLDEYIKPAVASDGGNIAFDSYAEDTRTVRVILQGACSGCPSSTITLKNGIEATLKELLKDKVMAVEAING